MLVPSSGSPSSLHRPAGFSLLELVTVIMIIMILGVMLLPVLAHFQASSEKLSCTSNLKSLHTATNSYVQDHQEWPQIAYVGVEDKTHPRAWIAALSKYGLSQKNWICPTIQREAKNPDLNDPENVRIDYMATTFDAKPNTPYKWATQPWFIEKGAAHGHGNLIIYGDGRVEELLNVRNASQVAP